MEDVTRFLIPAMAFGLVGLWRFVLSSFPSHSVFFRLYSSYDFFYSFFYTCQNKTPVLDPRAAHLKGELGFTLFLDHA